MLLVFGLTLIVVVVSQIASDSMTPSETKIALGAGGTITLVSMAWVFLMFRRMELFRGRKSRLFWWGLGIFGAAFWGLFAFLWAAFVSIYSFVFSADFVVQMLGSTSLMAVAYFMMREGAKLKAAIPQLSNQLPKASHVFRFEKVKSPGLIHRGEA